MSFKGPLVTVLILFNIFHTVSDTISAHKLAIIHFGEKKHVCPNPQPF